MDVIKIIQGGRHRKAPGRRIMMIKPRMHVPDQLVLRVHARIPEWCRCPDPVTAPSRAAAVGPAVGLVYRCPVIRDENASDDPSARGVISPGACVRCRFCGFYSVHDMIACRRMWDTMDFYAVPLAAARRIRPTLEPVEFTSMWRRGKNYRRSGIK